MRIYEIIEKKRDGLSLSKKEIDFFINGYTKGEIMDYQASALLMAVFLNGMKDEEVYNLTVAIKNSGDTISFKNIDGIIADKHSTGGVGDKTTLIIAPILACFPIKIAKMAGRSLSFTGGTIDKLESIPNFKTDISMEKFYENINKIGVAVASQTGNLTPADKKLYALRDVTATVNSIPLIASSIMSKKLAIDSDIIVLDVKCGNGAFMKNLKLAKSLANTMVKIGKSDGRKIAAIISDMNQPLGYNVGNSLEVIEAIEFLKGKEIYDLKTVCYELCANILMLAGIFDDKKVAFNMLSEKIKSGEALLKFKQLIESQDGNSKVIDDYRLFPKCKFEYEIKSIGEGNVFEINCEKIGIASQILGAGRETKESVIDLGSGIVLNKKIGDFIKKDEIIAKIYTNKYDKISDAKDLILNSFSLKSEKARPKKLILDIIN